MSVIVIDTSSWISYLAGTRVNELDSALEEGLVYLPPIVAAELCSSPKLSTRELQRLQSMLNDLPLCETPLDHWLRVGTMRAHLSRRGLNISTPDAHVAQCALDLHAQLVSEDRVFIQIAEQTTLRLWHPS